jgi:hypothetical protein
MADEPRPITWRDVAAMLPEFVAWVVATEGPRPEGAVDPAEYERLKRVYEAGAPKLSR